MIGYSPVTSPYWGTVFVVGGGPSLSGFDLERLKGQTVLAVNDAMIHMPWCTAVFSADRVWAKLRASELAQFKGERYLATGTLEPCIEGVKNLVRVKADGLSDDPYSIHVRGSSGYGALNLAYLKKAREIILLGFDYTKPNQHWFPDYSWSSSRDTEQYKQWADAFQSTQPKLQQLGVAVINANHNSLIDAFVRVQTDLAVDMYSKRRVL